MERKLHLLVAALVVAALAALPASATALPGLDQPNGADAGSDLGKSLGDKVENVTGGGKQESGDNKGGIPTPELKKESGGVRTPELKKGGGGIPTPELKKGGGFPTSEVIKGGGPRSQHSGGDCKGTPLINGGHCGPPKDCNGGPMTRSSSGGGCPPKECQAERSFNGGSCPPKDCNGGPVTRSIGGGCPPKECQAGAVLQWSVVRRRTASLVRSHAAAVAAVRRRTATAAR